MLVACLGLVIVAGGCAHAKPPCVSHCGMLLEDEGNGSMSCNELQSAEDKMLAAADELKTEDPRFSEENACKALFGWQLRLDENVITFIKINDEPALPAVGLSNCSTKEMWLGANQSWRKGSYPHEFFHVIQDCNPPKDWGIAPWGAGPGHEGWIEHGVYDMIEDFREGRR